MSTKSRKSDVDEIAWSRAESIIDEAKRADFLLIFDCCYAGKLAGLSKRKVFSKNNFDFLGASGANELAEVPGETSFTHALIKALRHLASDKEGFTTSELFNQILQCPTFPKHEQTPCLTSRTTCLERLLLAPLHEPELPPVASPPASENTAETNPLKYCLSLDFLLPELPNDEDMTNMCDGLKKLIAKEQLIAQKIIWKSLYRKREMPLAVQAAAHHWRAQTLLKNRRHSSIEHKKSPVDMVSDSPIFDQQNAVAAVDVCDHTKALENTSGSRKRQRCS